MRIQVHTYLAFKVEGQKLKPENTNPILHKFYHMLNDFKIEDGKVGVVVIDKDPANLEQMDSTWLKGSISLNMDVIDRRVTENIICGVDDRMRALIRKELLKLKVDEGKYSKHVKIEVLEVTFSETQRRYPNVWPREQIPIVGF